MQRAMALGFGPVETSGGGRKPSWRCASAASPGRLLRNGKEDGPSPARSTFRPSPGCSTSRLLRCCLISTAALHRRWNSAIARHNIAIAPPRFEGALLREAVELGIDVAAELSPHLRAAVRLKREIAGSKRIARRLAKQTGSSTRWVFGVTESVCSDAVRRSHQSRRCRGLHALSVGCAGQPRFRSGNPDRRATGPRCFVWTTRRSPASGVRRRGRGSRHGHACSGGGSSQCHRCTRRIWSITVPPSSAPSTSFRQWSEAPVGNRAFALRSVAV